MNAEHTTFPMHGHCDPAFARVRDVFAANFVDDVEVGASFCAVRDGRVVVDLWGGFRDREMRVPWTDDTLVNVYSTTKGIGAAVVAHVVGEGRLDYDAPVTRYWPQLVAARDGLTVAQLLSHLGGLCGLRRSVGVADLYDWQKMIGWLETEPPHWIPGTAAGYHAVTWGYLAGELVRRTTGKTLGTVLRERLAAPLDADVHVGLADEDMSRVADVIGPNHARRQPLAGTPPSMPALYPIALMNPVIRPFKDVGTPVWRRAEIAASNGHATGKGLARLYAALACGGELGGVRIVDSDALNAATREEWGLEPDLVLGRPMRRGRGFNLNTERQYGPHAGTFGHSGAGGSYGFADPAKRLGAGYAMNQMQPGLEADTRGTRLIEALYACL